MYFFQVQIENIFKEMQKVKCKEALESAVSKIRQKLQKEEYLEDGGETVFHDDYGKAERAYKECTNLGPRVIYLYDMFTSLVIHHR
jgi:hypothetical protein